VKLPIRDEALEERLAAIPTWLPIGVEAQLVTQCVAFLHCRRWCLPSLEI
jgi:hypothetical protein